MAIFKEIKNWVNDQKNKREIKNMLYLLNSKYELYESEMLYDDEFVVKVADYFSLLYNDLHYSKFDEKKHEKYSKKVGEWTQNFIEAEEMILEDVRERMIQIEKEFDKSNVDIKKLLFKDKDGQNLTDIIKQSDEENLIEDNDKKFEYYIGCITENQVRDEISLIQALSQAIQNGGIRRDGMPFLRGGVVAIKLDDFIKYEESLDTFVENINLPDNPNMYQFKKALKAYKDFTGNDFNIEDFASYDESLKNPDPAKALDNACFVLNCLHQSFATYQKQFHVLDVYKPATVYDQMIIPNYDIVTYALDPMISLVPTEIDSLFKMLDGTDSRITIDKRFEKHYARKLKTYISSSQAKEYFQVSDSNDNISNFNGKDDDGDGVRQYEMRPTK